MTSQSELREFLEFAKILAQQAGEIAKRYASDVDAVVNKNDNSPVTQVDEEVNQLVIDRVAAKFPDIGVLGEEQSSNGGKTSGLLWGCDPLDGTIPFVLGMQISTFCLALVEDGAPIVGVVYDFAHGKLYSAAKGLGAWCNDQPLVSSKAEPLPFVPVEWWHSAPHDVSGLLRQLQAARYQTMDFSSYSYTCLLVALGKIKGAVYAGDKPWDVAAMKVILDQIGFRVTDLNGREQRYDQSISGAIVSNSELHKELFGDGR